MSSDDDIPTHPKRQAHPEQQFDSVGDKRLRRLQKVAWDAGWWPERKRNGIMWLAPDGSGQVMLHGSASDHRAHDNAVAEFRKAGLEV